MRKDVKATDALGWLRDKATIYKEEVIIVEDQPWKVTAKSFRGYLPRWMLNNLKKNLTNLIRTEYIYEVVLNHKGQIEYLVTHYELIGDEND